MADPSPLAGLLDRASHVFSLAWQLACAFTEEDDRQRSGHEVDPTAWGRQQPAFNVFCDALLELRDEMQNPPDGFASVAEVLMEAARIAKRIRDVMQTREGQGWQSFLEFRFHFNSVVAKGNEAVRAVRKARRPDDPFAFLDQPATGCVSETDTTPAIPQPASSPPDQRETAAAPPLAGADPTGGREREEGAAKAEHREPALDDLPERSRLPYLQCRQAVLAITERDGVSESDVTDNAAYGYWKDEGVKLPPLETWKRNLREARKLFGQQKRKPRPKYEGRSAAHPEHFGNSND